MNEVTPPAALLNLTRPIPGIHGIPSARDLRQILNLVLAIAVLFAALFAVRSAYFGLAFARPMPFWDLWAFVNDLRRVVGGTYQLSDLFSQHNEHRIFTSRLHFLADTYFFNFSGLSLILANYLILLVLGVFVAFQGLRDRAEPGALAVASLILLAGFWSLAQHENLGRGFQVGFCYVHLFAALTLWAFASAVHATDRGRSVLFLSLACLADFLGVFSLASGVLVLVPAVALAVWLRRGHGAAAIFAGFHLVITALYFAGLEAQPHHVYGFGSPLNLLFYTAAYLGSAFRPTGSSFVPVAIGLFGLAAFASAAVAATWRSIAQRRSLDEASAILLALAGFVVAQALATAYGRATSGLEQALSSRYATSSILFWASLGFAGWRALRFVGQPGIRVAGRLALATTSLVAMCASNLPPRHLADWRAEVARIDHAAFAVVNGFLSDDVLEQLFPKPRHIRDAVILLRERGLGPFAETASVYKPPLNRLARAGLSRCRHSIDLTQRLGARRLRIAGWVAAPEGDASPSWILFYGDRERLAGYTRALNDSETLPGSADPLARFDLSIDLGAEAAREQIELTLIATFGSWAANPCGVTLTAEASKIIIGRVPTRLRPKIAERLAVHLSGDAVADGVPRLTAVPQPFLNPSISGTWRNGDGDRGAVTLRLDLPDRLDEDLALPLIVGPSVGNLSAIVLLPEKGITLPLGSLPSQSWSAIIVPREYLRQVNPGSSLEISLRDDGSDWGQWLAVADPYWIKAYPDDLMGL